MPKSLKKGDTFVHPNYGQAHVVALDNTVSLCGRLVPSGANSPTTAVATCARCREGTDYSSADTMESIPHLQARTASLSGTAQERADALFMEAKVPWLVRELNAKVIL